VACLDPEQSEGVRRFSVSALIRRLVQKHLEKRRMLTDVPPEAYLKIVALGSSGLEDVSEQHDFYLGRRARRALRRLSR
jgi:hypothetical protein